MVPLLPRALAPLPMHRSLAHPSLRCLCTIAARHVYSRAALISPQGDKNPLQRTPSPIPIKHFSSSLKGRCAVNDATQPDPYASSVVDADVAHWRDRLLDRFPSVAFAFAYGSGISSQSGSNKKVEASFDLKWDL